MALNLGQHGTLALIAGLCPAWFRDLQPNGQSAVILLRQ